MKYQSDFAQKFYARLITSQLNQPMISYFCSRYGRLIDGRQVSGVKYEDRNTAFEEVETLAHAVAKLHPRCVPEHEEAGRQYLRNLLLTPKGDIRNTAKAREFTARDQLFVQQLRPGKFEIHFIECSWLNTVGGNGTIIPHFRVTREVEMFGVKELQCLHYTMTPWQSGGYFEILQHV